MEDQNRKLPVGIQNFEKMRANGNIYVDKTGYIYRLVHSGAPCFLSRPRRFGKSLLLSTMRAYWEGKKELFEGLKIEELEVENKGAWQTYPVFYFDLNRDNYAEKSALEGVLNAHLIDWEEQYGIKKQEQSLAVRFQNLLAMAYEQTRKRCVVLVDEYDKPLLETVENGGLIEHNKAVFKGFFSALKSYDAYLQFVFITGVTKFSKVSIFSDLNQLRDISMNAEYAAICGITEEEMTESFEPEIQALADEQDISFDETLGKLKQTYDGYRFHPNGPGVYNPYSLLNALADREFNAYWFETGTPTFLVKRLKEINFDIRKFTDRTLYANRRMVMDYRNDNPDPIPILYQTGYLTILDYEKQSGEYTLGFPNDEVKYGFLESLMPVYVDGLGAGSGKDIFTLKRHIENGDLESVRKVLAALFASIPYTSSSVDFEHYFQTVIYLTFVLLGQFTYCEMHTYLGRIDCVVEAKDYVYFFEFKRDASADEALQQIEDQHYADPYAADPRKLFMIGVNFDSGTRMLAEWKVAER